MGSGGKGSCAGCITRIPYATLIAVIMSWAGVGVFCGTMYRGVNITLRLLQDVFKLDRGVNWIEPVQLTFVILGASMAALALMILGTAVLATGDTRESVYRSNKGRIGGRVVSAAFIFIIYVLLFAWFVVFSSCIAVTVFYTVYWGVCTTTEISYDRAPIDFYPYHFLFPEGTQKVNMKVEGQAEIKLFCIDYVEKATIMFILATVACWLVIMSLIHFLMALSANYAHIRGHVKFTELQDLHDIASETMTLTDRDAVYIQQKGYSRDNLT